MNVPQPVGFLVTAVVKSSPSALAGVRGGTVKASIGGQEYTVGGDVILKIADSTLTTVDDRVTMREQVGGLPSGSPYGITLLRGARCWT